MITYQGFNFMNRKEERNWVIKLIYQHNFNEINEENIDNYLENFEIKNNEFIETSVKSILLNIDKIDSIIKSKLNNTNFDSIMPIDLAILRVSINEFIIQKSVPTNVSINEAVENSKIFSNDKSYKLINGLLSAIEKEYR